MKLRQKQQLEGIFYSFFLTFEKKTMWLPAAKHSQNENKTLGFVQKLFRMCYLVVLFTLFHAPSPPINNLWMG